jgi:pimeloyl-ACP methyl ester carboxylesterase
MNAVKMAEDIEAVLQWIGQPVILYGHSAGAAAAIIAAGRNPSDVELLFLEACYAETKAALLSLYRWFNRFFGTFFGPMILWWMDLFYQNRLDNYDPVRIASTVTMPVMIIHGENDRRFPLDFALKLKEGFTPGQAEIYIARGAGHSDASLKSRYKQVVKSFLDRHLFERQN